MFFWQVSLHQEVDHSKYTISKVLEFQNLSIKFDFETANEQSNVEVIQAVCEKNLASSHLQEQNKSSYIG